MPINTVALLSSLSFSARVLIPTYNLLRLRAITEVNSNITVIKIKAEEEARIVAQGGFGRSNNRGIGGILGKIRRIQEEDTHYCFVIA